MEFDFYRILLLIISGNFSRYTIYQIQVMNEVDSTSKELIKNHFSKYQVINENNFGFKKQEPF